MGKNVSVGFNSVNNTDEIDAKENIYTRDYWTDILLFIDILISSGSFEPEIRKLLRKLTLDRNLAIYIIYTNCSEEDNEGNITLYKKFIDTVNIFCKKVMELPAPIETEIPTESRTLTQKKNNDNIDIINCEYENYEEGNCLDFIIPNKKFTSNHKLKSKNSKNYNSKTFKKQNIRKSKYIDLNISNDNLSTINSIDYEDKIINTDNNQLNKDNIISLENCENEEIDDFEFINQKEDQNLPKETKNINSKNNDNLKDSSSSSPIEYIINENDFFKPSKISIDNIPSTLKLNTIKNKTISNILKSSTTNTLNKNNTSNSIKQNNNDCFIKELNDKKNEVVELITSDSNKKNLKKHKYLKKIK